MGWVLEQDEVGVLGAALVTPILLPLIGWRGMFAVGLLPAFFAYFIRRMTAEPELFVRQRAHQQSQSLPQGLLTKPLGLLIKSLGLLIKDGATVKTSIGIFILCAVQNFGYYGIMIWMPTYLATGFGYTLTRSALWTGATVIGMIFGIWLFGHLADWIGRRPSFLLFQTGAIAMVYVYSQFVSPGALLIGGAVMGMFVNGMLGGYGALISECYPTQARATAQNVLFNLGRAVGGFGPLVVGALAARYSFSAAIALLASIYVLDILATVFLIPELKGAELY